MKPTSCLFIVGYDILDGVWEHKNYILKILQGVVKQLVKFSDEQENKKIGNFSHCELNMNIGGYFFFTCTLVLHHVHCSLYCKYFKLHVANILLSDCRFLDQEKYLVWLVQMVLANQLHWKFWQGNRNPTWGALK